MSRRHVAELRSGWCCRWARRKRGESGSFPASALSSRGERRTVDAGYGIQIEKPEVVIDAIDEVLALARESQASAGNLHHRPKAVGRNDRLRA